MDVKVSVRASKSFSTAHLRSIKKAIRITMKMLPSSQKKTLLKKARSFEMTVLIVGVQRMKTINQRYRGKNKPTDVLSFSRMETPMPIQPVLEIGDLVICLPIAKEQAKRFHETLNLELQRLTVHGMLHLFGYDHEKGPEQEKRMFFLQDKILKNLSPRHFKT